MYDVNCGCTRKQKGMAASDSFVFPNVKISKNLPRLFLDITHERNSTDGDRRFNAGDVTIRSHSYQKLFVIIVVEYQ